MADRYQDRPFADDDYGREADRTRPKGEGDPLAELARLIGQTDPFAHPDRSAPRRAEPAPHDEPYHEADVAPPGPPPWMARANAHGAHQEPQQQEFENLHPLQRYAAQHPEPEPDYHQAPAFAADADHHSHEQADPGRYDEALYGQPDHGQEPHARDQHYQEDPYYQDGYDEPAAPKRRSGLVTVGVVLALAVVGTGAAFAYRTFVGTTRSGEPPVIKADTGPNKMVPPSASTAADANSKLIQDRLGGAAPEKLVSREETPVNVQDNTKAGGPRVVFPPLNQNNNPPSTASVSPANKPMVGNGSVQGDEPRKIRTFAVKGDQPDGTATPASRQAPAKLTGAAPAAAPARATPPSNANASANAPMSLSPQAAPATAPARVANNAPQQIAPAPAAGGGYVVQIASQRSEAEASASFRALQGKYPSVLGSRTPTIKRADLGEKGVYYRAMVGPFGSPDEASQFCGSLKSAGGQCVVQRN
jgi:hypothetical protein